ncbi:MAG: transporter [Deltaproteobacteria bacterium]|nr:transporter [Deltaproteobacteria bacterium]
MRFIGKLLLIGMLMSPATVWAAHPLITDDAGTQGKGNFQFELNGQYDSDEETVSDITVKSTGWQVGTTLSYGVIDTVDLVLTLPYQWGKVEEDGFTVYDEKGISDTVFEVKWRFFEKDGLGLALKPGITLPTGDDEKGLGTGKTGYQLFFIGSQEVAPWAFHLNLGYIGNENKVDEEKNIWHASLATTYDVVENLKIVGNIGVEKNPDKAANNDPAFILGGLIYSITENLDIDCGVKYGLTSSETDMSVLAGMSFRF